MCSNFGQILQQTTELSALEDPKIPQLGYNGENSVYTFSWLFTYLRTIQNILMTCWLSGERSFPFVYYQSTVFFNLLANLALYYEWSPGTDLPLE